MFDEHYRDQVRTAAKVVNARITELSAEQSQQVRAAVLQRFVDGSRIPSAGFSKRRTLESWPLWEALRGAASVQAVDGWRWVSDFVGNSTVVMFFNEDEDRTMFRFADGAQLVPVLEECTPFEFYLTNDDAEYLICFNHHDVLIGAGTAALWLEQRSENRPSTVAAGD
jgi:hypothetical protein